MKQQIWFTSDTHYAHKNICRGVSEWKDEDKTRNFSTLESMNWRIVKQINNHVEADDILYHLGDWSFNGVENIWNFRKQIICKNVHLIFGNHDQHIKKNNWSFEHVGFPQDNFLSVQGYLELEIGKQTFVLSHYPMEEWLEMDRRGGIMLHGHCHHAIDESETNSIYRRMDVGMDWREFRPFSLEEVLDKMKGRPLKKHNALLK